MWPSRCCFSGPRLLICAGQVHHGVSLHFGAEFETRAAKYELYRVYGRMLSLSAPPPPPLILRVCVSTGFGFTLWS